MQRAGARTSCVRNDPRLHTRSGRGGSVEYRAVIHRNPQTSRRFGADVGEVPSLPRSLLLVSGRYAGVVHRIWAGSRGDSGARRDAKKARKLWAFHALLRVRVGYRIGGARSRLAGRRNGLVSSLGSALRADHGTARTSALRTARPETPRSTFRLTGTRARHCGDHGTARTSAFAPRGPWRRGLRPTGRPHPVGRAPSRVRQCRRPGRSSTPRKQRPRACQPRPASESTWRGPAPLHIR